MAGDLPGAHAGTRAPAPAADRDDTRDAERADARGHDLASGSWADDAIALCDRSGRVVQWTTALRSALGADPERDRVAHAIARLVRGASPPGCTARCDDGLADARSAGHSVATEVTTGAGTYRLRAVPLADVHARRPSADHTDADRTGADHTGAYHAGVDHAGDHRATVAVFVEPLGRAAATAVPRDVAGAIHWLRGCYGLTGREIDVALLLTEGHANKQIAAALGISIHTTRHHLTSIMAKMRASGRAAVAVAVLRLMVRASRRDD
jgi:DNA-binding CsgD family transcriptional regulator